MLFQQIQKNGENVPSTGLSELEIEVLKLLESHAARSEINRHIEQKKV
jgi:hypothetical protein